MRYSLWMGCRLYVHVTVFRSVREAEVIFMQQVTEIYGREDGWGDSAQHFVCGITPPLVPDT